MAEPLCDSVFDFEFERQQGRDNIIPRADLQAMMFTEMQELLSQPEYSQPSPPRTVNMGGAAEPTERAQRGRRGEGKADGKEDGTYSYLID
jgi:hypothetical protein